MFGEESIYGQTVSTLDCQGRIFLPTYTKRECGESLVLTYDNDISLYQIFSCKVFDELVNELQSKILNSNNKLEEIKYKKRIYEISKSIIKKLKVDSQGRINIRSVYNNVDSVLCIGAGNCVILEPTTSKETVR